MECRTEARDAVHLKVVLHAKGNNLVSGRVRNLSPNGMYVQTDPEGIRRNSTLRVGLLVDNQLQVLHTRVARKTADGLGLVVLTNQAAVRQALSSVQPTAVPAPVLQAGRARHGTTAARS